MPDDSDLRRRILAENRKIMKKFVKSGVDPDKKYEFEFQISLIGKEDCVSARALFRKLLDVPADGIFMVVSD